MTSPWADFPELIPQLVGLWNGGKSAREIAPVLGHGLSRSAVTTKISRLRDKGFEMRSTEIYQAKTAIPLEMPAADPAPRIAPVTLDDGSPITAQNAKIFHCRYPYGEPFEADFRYCGRQVAKGSFCDAHWKNCHQPKHAATQDLEAP